MSISSAVNWAADKMQMLPFGGQGSNQAMEDAGALGYLFNNLETESVTKKMTLFEIVRRKRASRVQIMSKVRIGRELEVQEELLQYADPPGSGESSLLLYMEVNTDSSIAVPTSFAERNVHDYGCVSPSHPRTLWLISL